MQDQAILNLAAKTNLSFKEILNAANVIADKMRSDKISLDISEEQRIKLTIVYFEKYANDITTFRNLYKTNPSFKDTLDCMVLTKLM